MNELPTRFWRKYTRAALTVAIAVAVLSEAIRREVGDKKAEHRTVRSEEQLASVKRTSEDTSLRYNLSRMLTLFAEVLALSLLGNAAVGFAFLRGFRSYWGALGSQASEVVTPAFAGMGLLVVLMSSLVPIALLGSLLLGNLAWPNRGSVWRAEDVVFQLCGGFIVGAAMVLVIEGHTPRWSVWPLLIGSVVMVAHAYWMLRNRPNLRTLLGGCFIAVVIAAPTMGGELSGPRFDSKGHHDGNVLTGIFDPSGLVLAEYVSDKLQGVIVLGTTSLGDPVVVDPCVRSPHALVVERSQIRERSSPLECA